MSREEFEYLYNSHWEKLYNFCEHLTANSEISKGLVQNIFLSIWERKDQLSIRQEAENYLFGAAKLKVAEFFRNKSIRKANFDKASANWKSSENTTENAITQNELSHVIAKLVNAMPSQCKMVYKLSRENGLRNLEIANRMAISEKTVENHLTRALNLLRIGLRTHS